MSCDFPTLQLSGLVAVDDETPDAFLDATRARYGVIAPNRLFHHAHQARAVSRCMTSLGEANIVGHGKPGVIGTGCGLFENQNASERIAVGNIGGWTASGMTKLTLLGCNTGDGKEGAELLFAIANATGAIVTAPTGYVYIGGGCEDYYFEPGTSWQTATPDARPEPKIDFQPSTFSPRNLQLISGARLIEVPLSSVASVILHEPGPFDVSRSPIRRWDREDTFALISRVEFDKPVRRGTPAAFETGKVEIFLRAENIEQRRLFRIYNDNRLQDMSHPEVFYRANITALRA